MIQINKIKSAEMLYSFTFRGKKELHEDRVQEAWHGSYTYEKVLQVLSISVMCLLECNHRNG